LRRNIKIFVAGLARFEAGFLFACRQINHYDLRHILRKPQYVVVFCFNRSNQESN
jgi:hypothetical protein